MSKRLKKTVRKIKRNIERKRKEERENGCGKKKKIKYDTYKDAELRLNYCQAMGLRVKRIYKCEFCGKFHLTSKK